MARKKLDNELGKVATQLAAADSAAGHLPAALRAYRDAHGITQRELAEKLGVSRVTVARVECGARGPSKALLDALATLGSTPAHTKTAEQTEGVSNAS